jgi:hypothetical protein
MFLFRFGVSSTKAGTHFYPMFLIGRPRYERVRLSKFHPKCVRQPTSGGRSLRHANVPSASGS